MLSPIDSTCRTFAIVSAVLVTLPCALAQERTGPALPPPSLYDETPAPPPKTVAPTQVPSSVPAQAEPGAAPVDKPQPVAAPVETPQPVAAPAYKPQPAAAPVEQAPVAATSEPEAKQSWNESLSPSGRTAEADQAHMRAPAAAPAVVPPPGRGSPGGRGPGFAYDSPNNTIRTGLLGQCLKTGFYDTDRWGNAPCPGTTPAPVAVAVPAPKPVPRPVEPEPVQVQPLAPEPVNEPRTLEPEPVAAPAPPPPPPPAPIKTTTLAADTLFALNSFQLRPTAAAKLDKLAAELDQFDYQRIHITGHTDPTGSPQLNQRLSRQRAEAVKRYLMSKGLPAGKIVTEGMGSSMPVVPNNDCAKLPRGQMVACYQPDRRVEIEVSGVAVAHK